jgi:pSer/pThr/pTyr-binding forkhead associated (FHA) protein
MRVCLIPLDHALQDHTLLIGELPVILTRSSGADLPSEAYAVSPYHCEIDDAGGVLRVHDLGSRHGTFVNEVRIATAYLWPGDKLTVGVSSFVVQYEPSRAFRRANGEGTRPVPMPPAGDLVQTPVPGLAQGAAPSG